jgi:hypothetical protein
MTFRVQRSTVDDAIVLMLCGDIAGDHTADLETLVDAGGNEPMVLDLRDVSDETQPTKTVAELVRSDERRTGIQQTCPAMP